MKRCLVLGVVVLCVLAGRAGPASAFPPGTGRYQQFGDAAGFLNILPPGQDGVMSLQEFNLGAGAYLPHMRDQQPMYADLVYNTPGLPESRLSDFYKDASFGVPDSDGDWLVTQGDALLGNLDPEMTDYAVGFTDTDQFKHIPFRSPAALELYSYAEKQAELRHECPGKDLISALLAPTIDGERLTDLQFKNLFVLMISAGNDTTRYTMAAGLKALAENPEQFQELRQACVDGDAVIVDRAVEEVLRWGSVTMHFRRTATQDVEMHGQTIRKGDKVLEWFSSANFDERQFPDPFRFDVHRWPNDHVAFNLRSPHLCLGAQLARMELKLLLQELLPRITAVEVVGPVERLRSNFICGMKRLPVKVSWT